MTHEELVAWCRANPALCQPKPLDAASRGTERVFGLSAAARHFGGRASANRLRAAWQEVYGAA